MAGGDRVVVDISSDDDVGFNDTTAHNFGWIKKMLLEEDDEGEGDGGSVNDDSDDVIVIKEIIVKKRERNKPSNLPKFGIEADDDDCIVLDGDPDKPVAEIKDPGDESDDLLIVSEKGPVACRDFPHSRHLCVKFPFSSTPRESHCDLCHCYVCDSVAPCEFWVSGASGTDHCHATDKDEFWKSERSRVRQGNTAPLLGPNLSPAPLSRPNSAPLLASLMQNPTPYNQVLGPAPNGDRSLTLELPNNISQARLPRPEFDSSENVFQPLLVSEQLCNSYTDNDELWKSEPERVCQGITAPLPGPNLCPASLSLPTPVPQLAPLMQIPAPYNQVPGPAPNSDESVSLELPNIISHVRLPRPGFDSSGSRFRSHLVSQKLHNSYTDNSRRKRAPILGPRFDSPRSVFKRPGLPQRVAGANQSNCSPISGSCLSKSRQLASCHDVAKVVESDPASLLESCFRGAPDWGVQHAPHQTDAAQISAPTVSSQLQGYGLPTILPCATSPSVYASGVQYEAQAISKPTYPFYSSGLPSNSHQITQPLIDNSQPHYTAVPSLQDSLHTLSPVGSSGDGTVAMGLGFERWIQDDQSYPGIGNQEEMSHVASSTDAVVLDLGLDRWFFPIESGPGIRGGSLHTDTNLSCSLPSHVDAAGMPFVEFENSWEDLARS